MEKLIEKIRMYQPDTDKEIWERQQILDFMEKNPDCLLRSNKIAHVTASAWVVNRERTKVLMAYHKIYNSWAWLGGHADGEAHLLKVAMKEAKEEAGLADVRPVKNEIFSIETLTVDGHMKRGSWVPSHLHLNVTYLLEADENQELSMKEDENSGVAWFTFDNALNAATEEWMIENIYKKEINKLRFGNF